MNVHSISGNKLKIVLLAVSCVLMTACAHVPPTIAHTHIGHAITGFDGAPEEKGLFTVAEERAQEIVKHADAASRETNDLNSLKQHVQTVIDKTNSDEYGLRHSLEHAVRHIDFAANSVDASANVKQAAPEIAAAAGEVLKRCDLIALLGSDVLATESLNEGQLLTEQIRQLAQTNLSGGVAADGAGATENGVIQVRARLDRMIDSENPPYVTVDRWYLFHLVRLPNCDSCWAWRKWANASNRGY